MSVRCERAACGVRCAVCGVSARACGVTTKGPGRVSLRLSSLGRIQGPNVQFSLSFAPSASLFLCCAIRSNGVVTDDVARPTTTMNPADPPNDPEIVQLSAHACMPVAVRKQEETKFDHGKHEAW